MSRRIASVSLLCAWLCASGAMLDLAQVVAWTRMFAGYARTESLAAAARETFDPGKLCPLCRAVKRARDLASQRGPAVPSAGTEKLVMIIERAAPFVSLSPDRSWPEAPIARAIERRVKVPVPPPRASLA